MWWWRRGERAGPDHGGGDSRVELFGLYREAIDRWFRADTPQGTALVAFSSRDQARNFALARHATGWLPAPLLPDELLRAIHGDDGSGGDPVSLLLVDVRMNRRVGAAFRLRQTLDSAGVRRTIRSARKQAARTRRRDMRRAARRARRFRDNRRMHEGLEAIRQFRFDDAAADFRAVIAATEGPEAARAATEIAELRTAQRQFDDARRHVHLALTLLGRHEGAAAARALACLGHCELFAGRVDAALNAFVRANVAAPDDPRFGLAAVRWLKRLGRRSHAHDILLRLHARHPDDPVVLDEVAEWLEHSGATLGALLTRRRLREADPRNTDNLVALGALCDQHNRIDEGFDVFARAIARTEDSRVILRFHLFCARQGVRALHDRETDGALRCFRTLADAYPRSGIAQLGLAEAAARAAARGATVEIGDDGVGPAEFDDELDRLAATARDRANAGGVGPAASAFDVALEPLLEQMRSALRERAQTLDEPGAAPATAMLPPPDFEELLSDADGSRPPNAGDEGEPGDETGDEPWAPGGDDR
jgi:tetratricopeptide (TPR) repeat protein